MSELLPIYLMCLALFIIGIINLNKMKKDLHV